MNFTTALASLSRISSFFITIPVHPLMIATSAYIMGIIWQVNLFSLTIALILTNLYLGIILYWAISKKINLTYYVWPLLIAAFFWIGIVRTAYGEYSYAQLIQKIEGKELTCHGTITSYVINKQTNELTIILAPQQCITPQETISVNGYHLTIHSSLYKQHSLPAGKEGDTISLKKLFINTNIHRMSRSVLLSSRLKEKNLGHMYYQQPDINITSSSGFLATIHAHSLKALTNLKLKMSAKTYALFSSIFLGIKMGSTATMRQLREQCSYWGIVHYLARSGLHVGLVIFIISLLLGLFPLPFYLKQFIGLVVILIYYLLTPPTISFIRALIIYLFYVLCIWWNKTIYSLHILTLTCLIILLINPFQLLALDFQLTFFITYALIIFNLIITRARKRHPILHI